MDEPTRGILGEQLLARLDAIQELVRDVPEIKDRLTRVEAIVTEHSARLGGIEMIVKEHSAQLKDLSAQLKEHSAQLKENSADLKEIKQIVGGQLETVVALEAASHTH